MPVIDVDAHFEPTDDWLDEFLALKARLPERLPTGDPRFTESIAALLRDREASQQFTDDNTKVRTLARSHVCG